MYALTPKQQCFTEQYLIDLNATQAAIRSGYSPRSASELGYQLLQLPSVEAEISWQMGERSKRTAVTQDLVVTELARIAFADPRRLFDGSGRLLPVEAIPEATRRTISHLQVVEAGEGHRIVRARFWNKLRALELLGRHLGLFGGPRGTVSELPGELDRRVREARRRVGVTIGVAD